MRKLLLILGAPLWIPLIIAFFAVVISLFISLWAISIAFLAVFASFVGCSIGGISAGIGFILGGYSLMGIAIVGAATVCAGIAIPLFFGCKALTNGAFLLLKNSCLYIKELIVGGEWA